MAEKLTQQALETMLEDTRWETAWRAEADEACQYYDGNQLTPDLVRTLEERGLAPLSRNLIGATINLVLGIEAKSKRDWRVRADSDDAMEVADAESAKLKQAERECSADRACSEAFSGQVRAGIGWVEVARESDPFKAPYRVRSVHRREIYWDFRAKELDLSDARYLIRKQWVDLDVLTAVFPGKAELLRRAVGCWADWDGISETGDGEGLVSGHEAEARSSIEDVEWRDTERERVCLYEVWYRVWGSRPVLVLPTGAVQEYDERNPAHVAAVDSGLVQVRKATFPKVRLAWWAGPHFLADNPSPYSHNAFPYVPFWGYREDTTGAPYGLIRWMRSPQDEVNARLSKMMWLLSAKRIITDTDALDMPISEVVEEAARPDAVILMNPHRKNKNADALRIESDFALCQQQFAVLQDATRAIQDSAGIYSAQLGKADFAGQSGAAINSLVEQGSTTLAKMLDNYAYARRQVGVLMLSYIKEDLGSAPVTISVEAAGKRRDILLNQPVDDPLGFTYLKNDVTRTLTRVELEEVPSTPTYKMQQFQNLVELAKSMAPEIQPLFASYMIRASDFPEKDKLADAVDQRLGLAAPTNDPAALEQQAQAAAQQQQQQEIQRQQLVLQLEELAAKADKARADAERARAGAMLQSRQAMKVDNDVDLSQRAHVMAEDAHALSQDEKALAMVQALQAQGTEAGAKVKPKKAVKKPVNTAG